MGRKLEEGSGLGSSFLPRNEQLHLKPILLRTTHHTTIPVSAPVLPPVHGCHASC